MERTLPCVHCPRLIQVIDHHVWVCKRASGLGRFLVFFTGVRLGLLGTRTLAWQTTGWLVSHRGLMLCFASKEFGL